VTPDDLEARLAGRPDTATVAAVLAALRADPDWTLTEFILEGETITAEMLHHPTGTGYTLRRRRRGNALHRSEGGDDGEGIKKGVAPAR
jgi:hypothetical protein